jgi:hypothetical protein
MTPKEKAKELVTNIGKLIGKELKNGGFKYNIEIAKQCALIAVEEILDSHYKLLSGVNTSIYKYWQEVKQEIELL